MSGAGQRSRGSVAPAGDTSKAKHERAASQALPNSEDAQLTLKPALLHDARVRVELVGSTSRVRVNVSSAKDIKVLHNYMITFKPDDGKPRPLREERPPTQAELDGMANTLHGELLQFLGARKAVDAKMAKEVKRLAREAVQSGKKAQQPPAPPPRSPNSPSRTAECNYACTFPGGDTGELRCLPSCWRLLRSTLSCAKPS